MDFQFIFIVYLIAINGICMCLFALDKQKAKHHRHRVSERVLWLSAFMGGAIGSFIGMKLFRHKTKKASFMIGIPLIGFIHIIMIIYMLLHLS